MGLFSGSPGQKGPNDKTAKTKCPKCNVPFANEKAVEKHQKRTDSLKCGANREYKGSF